MSIKIVHEDGIGCPTLFCDVCDNKLAVEKGKAEPRYVYDESDNVYIICSPKCHHIIDDRFGYKLPWMNITDMVINLWANLELDVDKISDKIKQMK